MYTRYDRFVADFETTTDEEDCRVWGWGSTDINNLEYLRFGNSMEDFIEWCKVGNKMIYFHNLAFDGRFILDWLFRNGYEYESDRKDLRTKTFTTLIGGMGEFYSLEICFYKNGKNLHRVVIYDSLKIVPMPVAAIPKAFGFEEQKGELDYDEYRPPGHKLTEEEKEYIMYDVLIVAKALKFLFDKGMTRMTTSSNALANYKEIVDRNFDRYFPQLEEDVDVFCRQSYRGGWTYLSDKYKMKDIGKGIVYDINSLYPFVMMNEWLPISEPVRFEGEYEQNDFYDLYIVQLRCVFELKEGYLPTIQLKNNPLFKGTEYLKSSEGYEVVMTLTNVDLELFMKHYDVQVLDWFGGYMFRSGKGMFDDYINIWNKEKVDARVEGNKGMDTLAKLMLNSLYGKMGTNPLSDSKEPYFDEKDNIVRYKTVLAEDREPIYVPVASFITAYARKKTITAAQDNVDRFIYADTDSIHLENRHDPDNIEIHETKLGAWGIDYKFVRARYMKQKTYLLELDNGEYATGVAGMRSELQKEIDFDNFVIGERFDGDLKRKTVPGGVILYDDHFTL